jgi:integrase
VVESNRVTTKKQIAAATAGWYPDHRCQGFALWVKPTGRKVWVLDYRMHGRQRRVQIGRADTLPADHALKIARKYRVAIDHGRDPLAEKEAARREDAENVTLTVFFERWVDEYARQKLRPRTLAEDRQTFARDVKPVLGRFRVADITERDVARLHRVITARPAPVLANRVVARLGALMTTAERWGVRPPRSNPCRFVPRNREEKRHRFMTGEQLLALGTALAASERAPWGRDAYESPGLIAAIRLLLFTGCRRGEVLSLQWADVNLEAGVLDLPTSKTGRKTVLLNAPARQVLEGLPRTSAYVLPGRRANQPTTGLPRAWLRIRARAGIGPIRLHDLRHTFGSTGAGLGASLPVIGALLGHTVPATTQRYAGVQVDPRREANERIGERLAAQLSPPDTPAPVGPIASRRRRHG